MSTSASASQQHLALVWRVHSNQLQLYVVRCGPRSGPWADFWHLPAIASDAHPWPQDARAAGMHLSPGFGPARPPVQVWAARAQQRAHQRPWGLDESESADSYALWLSVEDLALGHKAALMLLSPVLWATVHALDTCSITDPEGRLRAAADALQGRVDDGIVALNDGIAVMPLLTPTLPPATHTNCYLLGHKHLTLVDPGTPYPADQQAFLRVLQRRVDDGARIDAIWISHFHDDHIGAAMAVHERFGAPICAHADTAKALAGRVVVHRTLANNAQLQVEDRAFTALHTPGHAHGHLSFWAHQGGHLLSGDNILGTGTPIVPPGPHGSMMDYLASLEALSQRTLGMLLPGHGPPCPSAATRLQQTRQARLNREVLLLGTLTAFPEGASLKALVQRVYRGLGASLRGLAELSTLAHLEKLCLEGRVVQEGSKATPHWRLPIADAPVLR